MRLLFKHDYCLSIEKAINVSNMIECI